MPCLAAAPASLRHRPSLGGTVDAVLRAFVSESDEWVGLRVYEAVLLLSEAGPSMRFRVQNPGLSGRQTRIGVALHDGLCIRDSTEQEERELVEGLRRGFVQIERLRSGGSSREVIHQATGSEIPTR